MTVLEVTAVPFSYAHSGGGERYPTALMKELSKYENVIGCYSTSENIRILDNDFIVPAMFLRVPPFVQKSNPIPHAGSMKAINSFLKIHREEIEFIHIHNLRTAMSTAWLSVLMLHKQKNFRVILTDHNAHFFPFPSITSSMVDYYAAVSGYSNLMLQKLHKRPYRIFPTTVEEDLINNSLVRPYEHRDIDLLFVGRLVPWKAPDQVINTVNELRNLGYINVKAVIAGRPMVKEYYNLLKDMILNLNLEKNIEILNSPDDSTIMDLYSRAKVHILLSTTKDLRGKKYRSPELSPTTIAEAGVFGTPSVVSDAPGISEAVFDSKNGFIVSQNDFRSAAKVISGLISKKEFWEEFSAKAIKDFKEKRSIITVGKNFKNFLDDIRENRI